jgi:hypothetical protein
MRHRSTAAWSLGSLLLAAVSFPAATATQAATISVDSYIFGGTRISFRGEIVRGDERRFRAIADRVPDDAVVVVALASPGGDVDPAVAIGLMVRERGFMTMVWSSAGCASACALIWLAGQASRVSCAGLREWSVCSRRRCLCGAISASDRTDTGADRLCTRHATARHPSRDGRRRAAARCDSDAHAISLRSLAGLPGPDLPCCAVGGR